MSVIGGEGNLIKDSVRTSSIAAPSHAFSKIGTVGNGDYLLYQNIPSNRTGAPNFLLNSFITGYAIFSDAVETYDIEIEEHDRTTYTSLSTLTVTTADFDVKILATPIALTTNKRIAVKVTSGGANKATDPIVYLIYKGDVPS